MAAVSVLEILAAHATLKPNKAKRKSNEKKPKFTAPKKTSKKK